VTRIVVNPSDLRRGARVIGEGGLRAHEVALRLRSRPLPQMPAGVGSAVSAAIARSSATVDGQVMPFLTTAADLERRAFWAEISGLAGEWPQGLGLLLSNRAWLRAGLSFFGPGGVFPTLIATANGYRIVPAGDYARVFGNRFPGDDAWSRYLRTGRLPGTRYLVDNPAVARTFRLGTGLAGRAAELFPLDSRFVRAAGKGSGPLALGLTIGGDVWDFTGGPHGSQGLGSTDFAATTITDVGILGGTAAISTGAGVGAVAVYGAAAGSVVPGVGTAVGFVVAGGVAYFLTTDTGKAVRSTMISGTKSAIQFTGKHPYVLAPLAPAGVAAYEVYDHRGDIVHVGGQGLHYAGEGLSDAGKGLNDARKLVGGLFH